MAWLKEKTGLRELWVGEEFALGKDRVGTVERLTEIGADLGFRVVAVPRLTNGEEVVSSSRVRAAVMNGDVATARRLLGRPFRVTGEVVHGQHLGREIGFPTANVVPPDGLAPLADGIYAAWGWLPGDEPPRPAVAYVGSRPTVDDGERMVETHLLDFDGDLYGQTLATDLLERIRPDARFDSLDDLIAQMQIDKAQAREVLASGSRSDRVHSRGDGKTRMTLVYFPDGTSGAMAGGRGDGWHVHRPAHGRDCDQHRLQRGVRQVLAALPRRVHPRVRLRDDGRVLPPARYRR